VERRLQAQHQQVNTHLWFFIWSSYLVYKLLYK
jgi:hypothetical protein